MFSFDVDTRIDGLRNDVLNGVTWGVQDKRDKTLPKFLMDMQSVEREKLDLPNLKIVETKNFGYVISIPRRLLSKMTLPSDYERRQTLSNEERYTTPELLDAENRIVRASEVRKFNILCFCLLQILIYVLDKMLC